MSRFQKILLGTYSLFKKSGLLEKIWFKKVFLFTYFWYKRNLEDPFFKLSKVRPELFQSGHILDIGANIGYTSVIFAQAIAPGFKVFAFEPDQANFVLLRQSLERYQLTSKVVPVLAAVGAETGEIKLWHNEHHHADHRVVTQEYSQSGIDLAQVSAVQMWSIDHFVTNQPVDGAIGLIKIDVQGYELPVCLGMKKTLAKNPNAIVAIEYAPESMAELGFEPTKVLEFFETLNYFIYILDRKGRLRAAHLPIIEKMVQQRGYIDLVCSHRELQI